MNSLFYWWNNCSDVNVFIVFVVIWHILIQFLHVFQVLCFCEVWEHVHGHTTQRQTVISYVITLIRYHSNLIKCYMPCTLSWGVLVNLCLSCMDNIYKFWCWLKAPYFILHVLLAVCIGLLVQWSLIYHWRPSQQGGCFECINLYFVDH